MSYNGCHDSSPNGSAPNDNLPKNVRRFAVGVFHE